MQKYKQQVKDMLEAHEDLFKNFKKVHDEYVLNPEELQEKLNEAGKDIIPLVQRWENNLCSKSEGGKYGKFSSNLADKFWTEVRVHFPKIDYVGMRKKKK
jgi:sulfatase maturation enzyme AslB (radical SAM superfamily)